MRTHEYALYSLAGEERISSESLIKEVNNEYDAQEAAIGKLVLAAAFEEMGLYYDAYNAYQSAVDIAPEVKNYKRLYAEFLKRQGMNLEAYLAYNK